jgi:transposase InsO family protein
LTSLIEDKRCAIAQLKVARLAGEALAPLVAEVALAFAVAQRTVWRWLAEGPPTLPNRVPVFEPSPDDIDAYVQWKGNAAAAWRALRAGNAALPTLRTYQRAIVRVLTPGDRAALRNGVSGQRRHQVYLLWEPEARNQIWETDHTQLEIPVLFPRAHRPRQPWLTTFIDGYSRAIMGWAISDQPSSATILAALGEGIRVDSKRGPFGGIPTALRPDRGLDFAAEALARACGVLGIRLAPTEPYSPHLKGKIERLHRSITARFLAEMPRFNNGPRDAAGQLWDGGHPVLTGLVTGALRCEVQLDIDGQAVDEVQDSIGDAALAGSHAAIADIVMTLLAKLALSLELRTGVLCCELLDQVNDCKIMANLCQDEIRSRAVVARKVCSALGQTQHPRFFPKGGKALDESELRQFSNPLIRCTLAGKETASDLICRDETMPTDPLEHVDVARGDLPHLRLADWHALTYCYG